MTRVLVTGASGFVGSHLSQALVEAGHEVLAMTRHPDDYAGPGRAVYGDVSEPDSLREASYALGVPKWKTVLRVVIPTAFGGISTGVMLGLARVMGETAPLLILVSYAVGINFSPTSATMASLPTMINSSRDVAPSLPGYDRTWAAALTLILIVMLLNLVARGISRATKLKEK